MLTCPPNRVNSSRESKVCYEIAICPPLLCPPQWAVAEPMSYNAAHYVNCFQVFAKSTSTPTSINMGRMANSDFRRYDL
jgi:hypothetical protein